MLQQLVPLLATTSLEAPLALRRASERLKSTWLPTESDGVNELKQQLDSILLAAGYPTRGKAHLWGVTLSSNDPGQAELLRAVLQARGGSVDDAQAMLEGTLRRRRRAPQAPLLSDRLPTKLLGSPDCGRPRIVLRASQLDASAFSDPQALVVWWEQMQEALMSRVLASAPTPPRYTLVVDCAGLRPYHFGR